MGLCQLRDSALRPCVLWGTQLCALGQGGPAGWWEPNTARPGPCELWGPGWGRGSWGVRVSPLLSITPLPPVLPAEPLADGAGNGSRGGLCSGWCRAAPVVGLKWGLGVLLVCRDQP